MPGRDQTGPSGQGSLTGRQMGQCTTLKRSRTINRIFRNPFRSNSTNRFGGRMGLGQRFRYRDFYFPIQYSSLDRTVIENDIKLLKEQLKLREEDLKNINEK